MSAPSPSLPPLAPHQDSARWDELIESVDPGAVLVAISSWMSDRLREFTTAEDIWQETLAMAWRDRLAHEWRGVRAYRAWLCGIARNRIRDAADLAAAQKRGGGQRAASISTSLDSSEDSRSALLPPRSTTPSRIAQHRERARWMADALASLPDELRHVVHLALFEELPVREVAERLGIGLSTAKRRLFVGAKLYRTRLEPGLAAPFAETGNGP